MQNAIYHPPVYPLTNSYKTFLTGIHAWLEAQDKSRLFWLAISMLIQSCIIVPATFFILLMSERSLISWIIPTIAIVMCLVTNLATLSTKITIPVFILSIVADIAVIISCLV